MQELALSAEDLELACRTDPELFFAEAPADVELAKSLCVDCPIRRECLAGALERREPWGVWGGELFVRGVIVPRKRPRGRPRKSAEPEPAPRQGADESTVAA
jgi:WhiB family transcriptional regulator, redox-sensing transcriptional regulator